MSAGRYAFILAGGLGSRLCLLSERRAKPAVPFGGKYRIIDFTVSNCVNSGVHDIGVLTQYRPTSLHQHIGTGRPWDLDRSRGGIQVLQPSLGALQSDWYQGTADAIYQNLYSVGSEACKYVLILAGDHVYKMDYRLMLNQHVESGADVTIGALEFDRSEASHFGVMELDAAGRIQGWQEKPADPKPSPNNPQKCHVSMGVYCFNREMLIQALLADAEDPNSSHDFGKDVVPRLIDTHRVFAYNFVDENQQGTQYWRDIGTIEAYYEANMDLVAVSPVFNLYDSHWPIRTYQRQYPPAKFVFAQEGRRMGIAVDSIVSMGSIISGGRVTNSILSPDVRINSYTEIESSLLFAHVNIGRYSRIRRAIIDRHIHIPERTEIGFDLEEDRKKYHGTETGIVVVVPEQRLFEEPE